jgi:serpin B
MKQVQKRCVQCQAFVEVSEAGTEAAAAMLFEAKTQSMAGRFNADHPFLFLIRDLGSGSILFLGRLADPAS